MTMVEKIARALEPIAWAKLGIGDTLAQKNRRTSSLRKARRILEGPLMEPTEAMVRNAIDAIPMDKYTVAWPGGGKQRVSLSTDECATIWRAMITKALSEAEEVGK